MTGKAQVLAPVQHILRVQSGMTLITAVVVSVLYGRNAGASALTGGLICVAANLFAAWRAFSPTAVDSATTALSRLYRAEMGKLVTIAALFVAVFAGWKTVDAGALIAGCAVVMVSGAIMAAFQHVETKAGDGSQVKKPSLEN